MKTSIIAISPHGGCGLLDPKPDRLSASERHQHLAMTSFAWPPPLSRPLLKHRIQVKYTIWSAMQGSGA